MLRYSEASARPKPDPLAVRQDDILIFTAARTRRTRRRLPALTGERLHGKFPAAGRGDDDVLLAVHFIRRRRREAAEGELGGPELFAGLRCRTRGSSDRACRRRRRARPR